MNRRAAFTDADGPELIRLVRWRLRAYHDHPEFEDLVAEGLLGALTSIEKMSAHTGCSWTQAGLTGAAWAVQDYLRERSPHRTRSRAGFPLPTLNSWETFVPDAPPPALTAPDPAPEIIDRLSAQEVWVEFMAGLPEKERPLFAGVMREEAPLEAMAQGAGMSLSALYQRRSMRFARYRAAHPERAR